MGFSLTWIAARGLTPDQVHEAWGVVPTGEREELPESDVTGVQLSSRWYVVVVNHAPEDLLDDDLLSQLSNGCEVVACWVEEHVMESGATAWAQGQRRWEVSHSSEEGRYDLEAEGEPPPGFAAIRDKAVAEQNAEGVEDADVDYIFDVPVDLAEHITGFRHDEDPELDDREPFAVLVPAE